MNFEDIKRKLQARKALQAQQQGSSSAKPIYKKGPFQAVAVSAALVLGGGGYLLKQGGVGEKDGGPEGQGKLKPKENVAKADPNQNTNKPVPVNFTPAGTNAVIKNTEKSSEKKLSDGKEEYPTKGETNFVTPDGIKHYFEGGEKLSEVLPDKTKKVYLGGKMFVKFLPDGTTEHYDREDGKMDAKTLTDGTKISYDKNGKETGRKDKDGKELKLPPIDPTKTAANATPDTNVSGIKETKPTQAEKELRDQAGNILATLDNLKKKADELVTRNSELEKKIASIKATEEANIAKLRAEVEERYKKDLAAKEAKAAAPAQPVQKTPEEILAEIRGKIRRGEQVSADEAMIHNQALIRNSNMGIPRIIKNAPASQVNEINTPKLPEGAIVTSRGEGGVNIIYNSNPNGLNFDNNAAQTELSSTNNPYKLSAEMMEKVELMYEKNLDKILEKDKIQNWDELKKEGAYTTFNRTDKKFKKEHKFLISHLNKLRKITDLEPKSGVVSGKPQNLEEYMSLAYQKAGKENTLDELKKLK